MVSLILLISAVIFFVLVAGFFAGAETGMYQLSRLRLRMGVESGRLTFVLLDRIMGDSTTLLHSMLIGNNLGHYLATSFVTYALLKHVAFEYAAELSATLIAAPVLLIFSEMLPKSLFFYRADTLMPWCGPLLFVSHKIFTFCGAVPVLNILSRLFVKVTGPAVPAKAVISAVHRPHISAIAEDTRQECVLSSVQTEMLARLATLSNIPIRSVMIPLDKIESVPLSTDKAQLLNKLKECDFTRLPVYDRWPANIVGYISIYGCLAGAREFTDLSEFIEPIRKLDCDTLVTRAIDVMQNENHKVVLVTRPTRYSTQNPVGLITMKDLVEELLGELAEW